MENQPLPTESLIDQAKKAILQGNTAQARELAQQVLVAEPTNASALLILAGLSDPHEALVWLNQVLDRDPANKTAREGMRWASHQLRAQSAAAWKPETSLPVSPLPAALVTDAA